MTETDITPQVEAARREAERLLLTIEGLENIILYTGLKSGQPEQMLRVVEDKLYRLLVLVRNRLGTNGKTP